MTSLSPKLGLVLPTTADDFYTSDIKNNWSKIDASPGAYICTYNTRPAWGVNEAGRRILETDTGLEWWWTGSAFVRGAATGLLNRTDGSKAYNWNGGTPTSTTTTYVIIQNVTSVVVPPGNRPLLVTVRWFNTHRSAQGTTYGAIAQGNANNAGVVQEFSYGEISSPNLVSGGGEFTYVYPGGLPPGVYDWSWQTKSVGGSGSWEIRQPGMWVIEL